MRQPRRERLPGTLHQLDDPGFARVLSNLLDARRTILPTNEQLAAQAIIRPADIAAAIRIWNRVQRDAGTGLEGVL